MYPSLLLNEPPCIGVADARSGLLPKTGHPAPAWATPARHLGGAPSARNPHHLTPAIEVSFTLRCQDAEGPSSGQPGGLGIRANAARTPRARAQSTPGAGAERPPGASARGQARDPGAESSAGRGAPGWVRGALLSCRGGAPTPAGRPRPRRAGEARWSEEERTPRTQRHCTSKWRSPRTEPSGQGSGAR